jgi:NAD(P)H-dependent FMN reductase
LFATPHYGACGVPASMKNLLDHLDFMVLNASPQEEMFSKKVFILTTGAGSAAAIKPIKKQLIHFGVNRVYALGLRMFTHQWDAMPEARKIKFEKRLRRFAKKFYAARKRKPYLSAVLFYHMAKFIIKRYIGEEHFPYENWKEKGYFKKRPF